MNDESMRDEIKHQWNSQIGDAVTKGDMDMAQKMSQITDQVIEFVMNLKFPDKKTSHVPPPAPTGDEPQFSAPPVSGQHPITPSPLNDSGGVGNRSFSTSAYSTPAARSLPKPNPASFTTPAVQKKPPHVKEEVLTPPPPPPPLGLNASIPTLLNQSVSCMAPGKANALTAQLKNYFTTAQLMPGYDESVNGDRLFIIFGRCWCLNNMLKLMVTRAVFMENSSAEARTLILKSMFPRLKAVCILANPDWMTGDKLKVWDAVDDFQQVVNHIRSQLPTAKFILPTLPIEAHTDFDPVFFQFNNEIARHYMDVKDFSVVRSATILPTTNERGHRKHHLSENLCAFFLNAFDKHLANIC